MSVGNRATILAYELRSVTPDQLDPTAFPDAATLQDDAQSGRSIDVDWIIAEIGNYRAEPNPLWWQLDAENHPEGALALPAGPYVRFSALGATLDVLGGAARESFAGIGADASRREGLK